jgi:hypothetical protein
MLPQYEGWSRPGSRRSSSPRYFFTFHLTYRGGIDRGHDATANLMKGGHFFVAVCAILSVEKYHSGRYVCSNAAQAQMEDAGLSYQQETLTRLGKTLEEVERDTVFINGRLKTLFQATSARQGEDIQSGIQPMGGEWMQTT